MALDLSPRSPVPPQREPDAQGSQLSPSPPKRSKAPKRAIEPEDPEVAPLTQRRRVEPAVELQLMQDPLRLEVRIKNFSGAIDVDNSDNIILLMDSDGKLEEKMPAILEFMKAKTTPMQWTTLMREFSLDNMTHVALLQTMTHNLLYKGKLSHTALEFKMENNGNSLSYVLHTHIYDPESNSGVIHLRTPRNVWPEVFSENHHLVQHERFCFDVNSTPDVLYVPGPAIWYSASRALPMSMMQRSLGSPGSVSAFKEEGFRKLSELRHQIAQLQFNINNFFSKYGCVAPLGAACLCNRQNCTERHYLRLSTENE